MDYNERKKRKEEAASSYLDTLEKLHYIIEILAKKTGPDDSLIVCLKKLWDTQIHHTVYSNGTTDRKRELNHLMSRNYDSDFINSEHMELINAMRICGNNNNNLYDEAVRILTARNQENRDVEAGYYPQEEPDFMNKIDVFDAYEGGYVTATKFSREFEDSYFIRDASGRYTGVSMIWPESSSNGNEYIECTEDAPEDWQGKLDYKQFIKEEARTFIKIPILGVPTMVLKPDWYDFKQIPRTNFFNLIDTYDPVKKFMTSVLASQNLPSNFSSISIDHCNQLYPTQVYKLEPISMKTLERYVSDDAAASRSHRGKTANPRHRIRSWFNWFSGKGRRGSKRVTNKKRRSHKKGHKSVRRNQYEI